MTTTVRTGVVLVTALLLQVAVVPWLTIAGVQVDLLLLVTLAAGLSGGPERGRGSASSPGSSGTSWSSARSACRR